MNLLICSSGPSGSTAEHTLPVWKIDLPEHTIQFKSPTEEIEGTPDAIIGMSISLLKETNQLAARFPDVPLYCYNWDCYAWIWKYARGYNWNSYGNLLKKCREVWVPSECTGRRTKQWWNIDNWQVVLSASMHWDGEPTNGDYALCCLREIPDPFWGKFEQACEELGIPYKMTNHRCSLKDYRAIVEGCRFICAPLYELSTGGLTLLEGYYLGKPCLVSDSKWNGARDYMGDRAVYFKHDDWEDFKEKLLFMSKLAYVSGHTDHRQYVTNNFSYERMVQRMIERISETIHSYV